MSNKNSVLKDLAAAFLSSVGSLGAGFLIAKGLIWLVKQISWLSVEWAALAVCILAMTFLNYKLRRI